MSGSAMSSPCRLMGSSSWWLPQRSSGSLSALTYGAGAIRPAQGHRLRLGRKRLPPRLGLRVPAHRCGLRAGPPQDPALRGDRARRGRVPRRRRVAGAGWNGRTALMGEPNARQPSRSLPSTSVARDARRADSRAYLRRRAAYGSRRTRSRPCSSLSRSSIAGRVGPQERRSSSPGCCRRVGTLSGDDERSTCDQGGRLPGDSRSSSAVACDVPSSDRAGRAAASSGCILN
jgi:hypothetical protein